MPAIFLWRALTRHLNLPQYTTASSTLRLTHIQVDGAQPYDAEFVSPDHSRQNRWSIENGDRV